MTASGGGAAIALAAAGRSGSGTRATTPPATSGFAVHATRAITLDPGCEQYPAFTRDGREILFDGRIERDIEIQAISADGRTRRRLTHSPGWDIAATPSPDGRRVAYIHFSDNARELRVVNIAGDQESPPIVVGPSRGFPAWTPDGDLVYGDDSGRLFRVSLDRTPLGPKAIAALPADHIAAFLAVFPDGEIAASVRSQAETGDHIRLGRAARGGDFAFIEPPITVSDCCNLKPDRAGRGLYHAALAADNNLRLHWRPRSGGDPIVLDRVAAVLRGFDVAPGGDRAVVSSCKIQGMLGRIEGGRFFPLPRLGTAWDPSAFDQVDPDFMVVSSARSGPAQIWRVDAEGRGDLVVDHDSKAPALSRDAARLAWVSVTADAPGVHVRAVAGGPILRLTTDARDDMPAFSHDGQRVYFTRATPDGSRVFAVAADGSGGPEPVSPSGVVAFAAASHRAHLAIITVRGDGNALEVGPPGGPFTNVPVAGAHRLSVVAFAADDREILVAPRRNLIVAVTPGKRSEPRVVWSAEDDTLYQVRLDRTGAVYAVVSTDEGDLYLVDGSFR